MAVSEWVSDFARRLAQLAAIAGRGSLAADAGVWLGGLFFPEAYVTATRQAVAHRRIVTLVGRTHVFERVLKCGDLLLQVLYLVAQHLVLDLCGG